MEFSVGTGQVVARCEAAGIIPVDVLSTLRKFATAGSSGPAAQPAHARPEFLLRGVGVDRRQRVHAPDEMKRVGGATDPVLEGI